MLSENDFIEIEKEYCKRSFAGFVQRAWPTLEPATKLKWGWALDAMCEHLEYVSAGEILRLLMNVPPGSMKSLMLGVFFPAWEWGPLGMQHYRYLGTAHKESLAIRDNLKCRRLINSEWYQKRWPVNITGDQNAKTKFENDRTGFRECMAFTSLTGSRGDRVLLDDPHSVKDGNSVAHLAAGVREFREALPSRVNSEDSAIVIAMQRLNQSDVSSVAIDLGYEHLCIPMRYEPGRIVTMSSGWSDPRTEAGELMFPERFSEKQVVELETSLGSQASAGQLQQRPAPMGGSIVKESWLRHWEALPTIDYLNVYADTAQKESEKNDFTVFELWAKSVDGPIFLIDILRKRMESPELLTNAVSFWDKWKAVYGGRLRRFKVEDKVSGTGLIQQLKRKKIPVEGIPRSRDKVSRAHDGAPQIEAGNVYLPARHKELSNMTDEITIFPNASFDDTVDPMLDAIDDMLVKESGFVFG